MNGKEYKASKFAYGLRVQLMMVKLSILIGALWNG